MGQSTTCWCVCRPKDVHTCYLKYPIYRAQKQEISGCLERGGDRPTFFDPRSVNRITITVHKHIHYAPNIDGFPSFRSLIQLTELDHHIILISNYSTTSRSVGTHWYSNVCLQCSSLIHRYRPWLGKFIYSDVWGMRCTQITHTPNNFPIPTPDRSGTIITISISGQAHSPEWHTTNACPKYNHRQVLSAVHLAYLWCIAQKRACANSAQVWMACWAHRVQHRGFNRSVVLFYSRKEKYNPKLLLIVTLEYWNMYTDPI